MLSHPAGKVIRRSDVKVIVFETKNVDVKRHTHIQKNWPPIRPFDFALQLTSFTQGALSAIRLGFK